MLIIVFVLQKVQDIAHGSFINLKDNLLRTSGTKTIWIAVVNLHSLIKNKVAYDYQSDDVNKQDDASDHPNFLITELFNNNNSRKKSY